MSNGNGKKRIKKAIVIHAGRHKTGTTFLQQVFGANSKNLLKQGKILYPKTGRNPYFHFHHDLIKALGAVEKFDPSMVDDFVNEVDSSSAEIVLISSEYLSRSSIEIETLRTVAANLSRWEVNILFYLRRPSDFLCSRYAQQIRTAALCYPKTIWELEAELDSRKFLERYIMAFGSNNIYVRSYDHAVKSGGLLKDFLEWMCPARSLDLEIPKGTINRRYSWLYISILRYANRYWFLRKLATSRLIRRSLEIAYRLSPYLFDGKKPISKEEAEKIDLEYSESNESALREYGNKKLTY